MTTDAGFGRLLISAADVAAIARQGHVSSRQLEVRLVMIELAAGPTAGAVALAARLRELAAVRVIRLMAADAVRRSLAPRFAFLVATLAVEGSVRALECEVGELMIELRAAELDDVGLAALVFRVASTALADAGVGHAAVVALMLLHVGGDILVTVQAQRSLCSNVGSVVAVRAGLFLLHMRLRHLAGHEQRLHIGAPCGFRCSSDKCGEERHGE